jgi:hypothetical protein
MPSRLLRGRRRQGRLSSALHRSTQRYLKRAWGSCPPPTPIKPEPDGRMTVRAAFALSAIEDTSRTTIWISKGPYLLAVTEAEALSQRTPRPKRMGRVTLRAALLCLRLNTPPRLQSGSPRGRTCLP